jgi:DNA mismatch repair protein MutS2
MDEHSLEILEFNKIRELLQRYAPCSLGAERVRSIVPSTDRLEIEHAQKLVGEMVEAIRQRQSPAFAEVRDVRVHVRRARAEAMLSADSLREISGTLLGLKRVHESLTSLAASCPQLAQHASRICDLARVAYDIEARIDERGKVMDSASRELTRLRTEMEKLEVRIRSLMQRLVRSESVKRMLSYPNYTVTGAHYVLPVAKDYRHDIAGIVHRTSASGDTLFIEPAEVAELSAEMALLRSHEQREVNRILRQLSGDVGRYAEVVLDSLREAAELACVFAKAQFALEFDMIEPRFGGDGCLSLQDARHPLLEHLARVKGSEVGSVPVQGAEKGSGFGVQSSQKGSEFGVQGSGAANGAEGRGQSPGGSSRGSEEHETTSGLPNSRSAGQQRSSNLNPEPRPLNPTASTVVPITVHLGGGFDVLIVTGPNTGGKTVALKTAGLLVLMAQAGLHIPAAEGSTVPVFDQVLADIGDEQSLEQSLSTFSSHVSRIAGILKSATNRTLVLLDELGAGTDPAEGAALGRAILDQLLALGVKAIVTTHLGDLKMYALVHPRAQNAAVEFDAETLRPTYHLRIGDTGQSSALVIARRLDLPYGIVQRAEQYLASSRLGRPQEIEVLEQRRGEAEAARVQAWQAEQEARRAKAAFETRLRELDEQAADALALDEFRSTLQPGDSVYVRKFRRPGMVKRIDHKRRIAQIAHGSMHWELSLDELEPATKI